MSLLNFIFGKNVFKVFSFFVKIILKMKYKISVGSNFYCEDFPKIKIKGFSKNIMIGNNVKFLGIVDLRNRENGKIIIEDNVTLEENCRLVAAREGKIHISSGTLICPNANYNSGGEIFIGKKCLLASGVHISTSDHMISKNTYIRDQGFKHGKVVIEDDCFIGTNVFIKNNIRIKKGTVIGALSVVTNDTEEFSINAGNPCKLISKRE